MKRAKPKPLGPVLAWAIVNNLGELRRCHTIHGESVPSIRFNRAQSKGWCRGDERVVRVEIREIRLAPKKPARGRRK